MGLDKWLALKNCAAIEMSVVEVIGYEGGPATVM